MLTQRSSQESKQPEHLHVSQQIQKDGLCFRVALVALPECLHSKPTLLDD